MRARWQALYRALERTVHNHHHVAEFARATRCNPILARFRDPQAIVDCLLSKRGDLDEKDRLLGALVATVQQGEAADMAIALLRHRLPPLDLVRCASELGAELRAPTSMPDDDRRRLLALGGLGTESRKPTARPVPPDVSWPGVLLL